MTPPTQRTAHQNGQAPARPGLCAGCRCAILTAVNDAVPVHLDPRPLNSIGELDAAINRIRTWRIDHQYLKPRNTWNIENNPPNSFSRIYAEHRCGRHPPAAHQHHDPPPPNHSDTPPF